MPHHPARWREVGKGGEGGDEEHADLRDPQHQTQGDHQRHGVHEGRRQCGATAHNAAPPMKAAVGRECRRDGQRKDATAAQRQRTLRRQVPQRPLDPNGPVM